MEKRLIAGIKGVNKDVTSRMLPHKLMSYYRRPTFLDIFAQEAIIISKRSTCLWNEVGAVVFYNGRHSLSSGYNGPAAGDVDPRDAGCARVVKGALKEGQGFCRGSHAEMNAMGFLTVSTMNLPQISLMVTLRPCFACAKQIANKGIKEVYYLWEYEQDDHVVDYLRSLGIKVVRYSSKFIEEWIKHNDYLPPRLKKK